MPVCGPELTSPAMAAAQVLDLGSPTIRSPARRRCPRTHARRRVRQRHCPRRGARAALHRGRDHAADVDRHRPARPDVHRHDGHAAAHRGQPPRRGRRTGSCSAGRPNASFASVRSPASTRCCRSSPPPPRRMPDAYRRACHATSPVAAAPYGATCPNCVARGDIVTLIDRPAAGRRGRSTDGTSAKRRRRRSRSCSGVRSSCARRLRATATPVAATPAAPASPTSFQRMPIAA
jgi:hypothetical protein